MRSVLRALSGIVAVAGGCAVIKLYTCPHIRCMCECACKKKRQNNTIFSGLYCFRVHCAKLEKTITVIINWI